MPVPARRFAVKSGRGSGAGITVGAILSQKLNGGISATGLEPMTVADEG